MIAELEPVWKQFQETYDALRDALAQVPDERLYWKPGPAANPVAWIVQHLARGNLVYSRVMEDGERGPRPEIEENMSRDRLLERLQDSEQRVLQTFGRMTPEALRQIRSEHWQPLGPRVEGPLDAFWFALQIVRHSAYHLGQINVYLLIWEGEGSDEP